MKRVSTWIVVIVLLTISLSHAAEVAQSEGWVSLFDGKTLSGWKAAEHPESITVHDGAIVLDGPRAHLFYTGDVAGADFRNFELKAGVMTTPGANSGLYFHTHYQETGFPSKGYEVQINNTYTGHGNYYEFKKTGSLYGIRNQFKSIVRDNEWFTVRVIAEGKRIRVSVNGTPVVDYTEPGEPARIGRDGGRFLSHGTFAMQCHDPKSKVFFRDLLVKPLPDDLSPAAEELPVVDRRYRQILDLQRRNFPLIDFHVHLKGGLTLEEALANSRKTGINYGIAPNCGLGFPITDDEGIYKFVESMKGQPAFLGMQAEGREWVNLFSKEAIGKFDYVFSDAMTFTDDRGKRIRLWVEKEVAFDDKQAFVEMCVDKIVSVISNEPIDVYVNATFLPACISDEYDVLWTPRRMQRVIDAAVKHDVAIEINARYRIPNVAFIKRAKAAGVKFTFGTNNGGKELGRLEYCLDVVEQCGLTWKDMFVPGR